MLLSRWSLLKTSFRLRPVDTPVTSEPCHFANIANGPSERIGNNYDKQTRKEGKQTKVKARNGRTRIVLHAEARLVTRDPHRIRRQWVVDLDELTTRHQLATSRLTVRRLPRHGRAHVGRHDSYKVTDTNKPKLQ